MCVGVWGVEGEGRGERGDGGWLRGFFERRGVWF
jgi:hypothetical protein